MTEHRVSSYCCTFIEDITERLPWDKGYSWTIPIKYSPCRRLYLMQLCPRYVHQGGQIEDRHLLEGVPVKYCPSCGACLPKDLTQARINMLKKEYKINLERDVEAATPPEEFFSDAWWKKRGL